MSAADAKRHGPASGAYDKASAKATGAAEAILRSAMLEDFESEVAVE
jgi:hypothetical protein